MGIKDTKSTFRLPNDPTVPLILIGPGTGVAPMLGFIRERQAMKGTSHLQVEEGENNENRSKENIQNASRWKNNGRKEKLDPSKSSNVVLLIYILVVATRMIIF